MERRIGHYRKGTHRKSFESKSGLRRGTDFTLRIPLDKPACAAGYIPKTSLWADIARFGEAGTARGNCEPRLRGHANRVSNS